MHKKELIRIVLEEKDNYLYGGGEDKDGNLERGSIDWDKIIKAIEEFNGA